MRIAEVSFRFDAPGGVETLVRALSRGLRAAGDHVTVFSSDVYDEFRWTRRSDFAPVVDGVSVLRFPAYRRLIPGLNLPLMIGLVDGLVRAGPELIHAHSHRYGHLLQSAAVAHSLDIPLVVTTHFHPPMTAEPSLKRGLLNAEDVLFGWTVYREARAIVTHTELERQWVREFAPTGRIEVIPSGIDLAAWKSDGAAAPSAPAPSGLPSEFMLYAGRVAANKGLPVLFEALARIPRSERIPLVVMGRDWGQRAALEALARERGLASSVVWLGHVDSDVTYRAVFRRARLLVLPSEWEAFGLVLLEAMAAGVPIVASAVGGVPEVLENGRAGLLVPAGDPGALAETVRSALSQPELTRSKVERGQRRVEEFDWERIVDVHRALYRRLLG
jgi:glycosyltransferase involved in cell wall biosynthesis